MTGKGDKRRPEETLGNYATDYERIFDKALPDHAAIITARTFANIEAAQAAAEAENEDFGPWN